MEAWIILARYKHLSNAIINQLSRRALEVIHATQDLKERACSSTTQVTNKTKELELVNVDLMTR